MCQEPWRLWDTKLPDQIPEHPCVQISWPLPDHAGESPLLSRSGGEKGLRGSGAGTLGVSLEGTRRVGGLLGQLQS